MGKIVLASNNKHKINDFKNMFKGSEVFTLPDIGFTEDIEETGETFYENALIKATAVAEFLKEKMKVGD